MRKPRTKILRHCGLLSYLGRLAVTGNDIILDTSSSVDDVFLDFFLDM